MKKYLLLFVLVFFIACDEEINTEGKSSIEVVSASDYSIFYGDTLVIYGENFNQNDITLFAITNKDTLDINQGLIFVNKSEIKYINTILDGNYSLIVKSNSIYSKSIDVEFVNHPEIETVDINGGSFFLGSEKGPSNENPEKEILISKNLQFSKFEVSEFLWKTVLNQKGIFNNSKTKPASNLNWFQAVEFCNKLSNLWGLDSVYTIDSDVVGFDTLANGWRLPTESEWEYAALGKTESDYYGFDNPSQIAWYSKNSGYNIQPSGKLMANSFGMYDMLGNLEEWCWDYYSITSYSQAKAVNPTGPNEGEFRVARGGNFKSGIAEIRCSSRVGNNNLETKGLRIVRTLQ
ncbi:SUMF1/EgtB/PvdO family nonheme iron enzyme [Candidatus Kapabacteria bacterium]|nr:SUMF1/EgtB/PvdO family nonheme iron enzyme [Candidatus Kapabacteria bacterium]